MTIDTAELRGKARQAALALFGDGIGGTRDFQVERIMSAIGFDQLCDELDQARHDYAVVMEVAKAYKDEWIQARTDVLKLRDSLRNHHCGYSWDVLNIDPCVYCVAEEDTEHYERYREES